jgi:hypothetical protein
LHVVILRFEPRCRINRQCERDIAQQIAQTQEQD